MPAARRRAKKTKIGPWSQAYLAARSSEPSVVGPVRQYLLLHPDRRVDAKPTLHPSQISKRHWCPRASYFELSGVPAPAPGPTTLTQSGAFGLGTETHERWQTWAWRAGILRGDWECVGCEARFSAISPGRCPSCDRPAKALRYREVPVSSPEHLIEGHADGDIGEALIEIKTLGLGTVRWEKPDLYRRHLHTIVSRRTGRKETVVNLEALWRDIHVPFPSHFRQGQIYLNVLKRDKMVFLYDCKFLSVEPKEFVVKRSSQAVRDILEGCLDVRYALKVGKAPYRPRWAAKTHSACRSCVYNAHCYATSN